jgi:hypothetical protein
MSDPSAIRRLVVPAAGVEEEQQMIDDGWRRVSAKITDEELEGRPFTYYWLR